MTQSLIDLYRRFAPVIRSRAQRIVGDDADDVVHDVFERLLRKLPDSDRALPTWFVRTSTNLCIDRLRYTGRRDEAWEQDLREHLSGKRVKSIDELTADKELCSKLLRGMEQRTQQVAILVHLDEMQVEDAAQILDVSRKTVMRHLRRFAERARIMIDEWQ